MRKPQLLAVVAGALLATGGLALPADAHMGGKIQLFLKDLKVENTGAGYDMTAVLVDRDSGSVATGFQTTVRGASADGKSFPETKMTPEQGGIYRLGVPAEAGDWTLTLRSVGIPGTDDAVPLVEQKRISFPAAGAVEAAPAPSERSGSTDDGGSSSAGAIVGLLAVVALAGVGGVLFAKRRRPSPAL